MKKLNEVQIPNQIIIGCHKYNLYFSNVIDADGHDGTTQHRLQQIWLAPKLAESRRYTALLHEVLHLICNTYCVRVLNESEIDALSEGLGQFLLGNLEIKFDWSKIKEIHNSKEGMIET